MRRHIGVYDLSITAGGGAEKSCAVMAEHLSRTHDVSFIVGEPCSLQRLESYFSVDLSRVRLVPLHLPVQSFLRKQVASENAAMLRRAHMDLFLTELRRALERTYLGQVRALGLDLFINKQGCSVLPCPAPRGVYMGVFPHELKGALRRDPRRSLFYQTYASLGNRVVGMTAGVLDSYQVITANSSFTAEWIERLWYRKATVVYSASEDMGPPSRKEKMILHVGRFVAGWRSDHKHQQTLLEVFRRMTGLHQQGWELHLAGTVDPSGDGAQSVEQLARAAAGLPVFLHPSVDFELLHSLYRRASVYWHATGWGHSPEEHPGKQEHFGITTVEAMSAGAVPVVINSGGHRETVSHGSTGFLWNDLGELEHYTWLLASDPGLRQRLSEAAVARSGRFSRAAFAERIEMLVDSLLAGGGGA